MYGGHKLHILPLGAVVEQRQHTVKLDEELLCEGSINPCDCKKCANFGDYPVMIQVSHTNGRVKMPS